MPHKMLNKLKVYHAPSAALNGQDLAIKSKWRGVKAVNKSRRCGGDGGGMCADVHARGKCIQFFSSM